MIKKEKPSGTTAYLCTVGLFLIQVSIAVLLKLVYMFPQRLQLLDGL